MAKPGKRELQCGWVSACFNAAEVPEIGLLFITLTVLDFHVVTIQFTQLPGDAYSWFAKVQNQMLTELYLICVHSKEILLLLTATVEPFSFFQYIVVTILTDVLDEEKKQLWKLPLCFDDYQIFELLLPRGNNSCSYYASCTAELMVACTA